MSLLPEIIDVSDKVIIYDNSIDFQTSIMLHKNQGKAIVFSDNPNKDNFLQETIIKPLEEKFHYYFNYCNISELKKLNILSQVDLEIFGKQVTEKIEQKEQEQ